MLTPQEICQLMPHEGAMCLIETLLHWDEEHLVCSTGTHVSIENPLRHHDRLSIIHAAEYGAQVMALHGGLLAKQSGKSPVAGFLVSLRGVKFYRQRLDDTEFPLQITARKLLADGGNLLYAFDLTLNHIPVAEGSAAVMAHREI